MPIISVFKFDNLPSTWQIHKNLNGRKVGETWLTAKINKYNKNEIFIQYWYYEDVEESMNKLFSDEDAWEVVSYLKQNGKSRILKRTYCFINLTSKTLEVYRGPDSRTDEIVKTLEDFLKVKFSRINLNSEHLQKIYSQHGNELNQAMFKNVDGLIYEILRGNWLEKNEKFKKYMQTFPEALRLISFRPKIKFLNGNSSYQVTINGDKGTVRLSANDFKWRPRFEVRQVVFIMNSCLQ